MPEIDLQKNQLHLSNPDATLDLDRPLDRPRELLRSNNDRGVQSSTVKVSELINEPSGPEANLVAPSCSARKTSGERLNDMVSRYGSVLDASPVKGSLWNKPRCRSCGATWTDVPRSA